ncbi:N-formylglutamate amidohydrolase [Mangrovicella endophytica]|uniref:N-formylglutamate amidohydrolase n=1 Tax=Mangrovicella endophytica TaxID=2066697 RepID=UPI000C9E24BC|nr:N-formylglutamate amidohydrolase [Mangrovicella endophytica]
MPTLETADGIVPAFDVILPPIQTIPFVFCSPHSGRDYPLGFLQSSRLSGEAIRRSEDLFVDQLFDFVPDFGAPMLRARFPRAFLDLNREPYELDPRMFEGDLPLQVNSASVRVASGLGTIPRIVAEREEIYRRKLTVAEAMHRIDTFYLPFHHILERLIEQTLERFGICVLVDCHSMPSSVRALPGGVRPDVVLGDRYGESASRRLVAAAAARLAALGYEVARNKPYAGGFITEHYGQPHTGVHALQIELNRALYADERRMLPHHGLTSLRDRLADFVAYFAAEVGGDFGLPAAAE